MQVSVLRVFHQLLSDALFRKQPGATEVCSFAARVVRNIMSKLVPGPAEEDAQVACEGALLHLLKYSSHMSAGNDSRLQRHVSTHLEAVCRLYKQVAIRRRAQVVRRHCRRDLQP